MRIIFLSLAIFFSNDLLAKDESQNPISDLLTRTYHISVKNEYLFASSTAGLTVYKHSGNMVNQISVVIVPNSGVSSIVDGDILYLFAGNSGVYKVDIKNPVVPVIVNKINVSGSAINGDFNQEILYVCTGSTGFSVIDKNRFQLLQQIETPSYCSFIKLIGQKLFVSTESNGILIYDVTKKSIKYVDNIPVAKRVRDIAILDDYIFLANDTDGIAVLKRGNKKIEKFNVVDTPDTSRGVTVFKDYLFVADGNTGLLVYKIEKDGMLIFVRSHKTDYSANKVIIKDDYAIISNDAIGIMMHKVNDLIK